MRRYTWRIELIGDGDTEEEAQDHCLDDVSQNLVLEEPVLVEELCDECNDEVVEDDRLCPDCKAWLQTRKP